MCKFSLLNSGLRVTRFFYIILIAFLGLGGACSNTSPLSVPEFDALSSRPAILEKAIKTSLLGRGWTIRSVRPGRIEASYARKENVCADIAVSYLGSHIVISYLKSSNLLSGTNSEGRPIISNVYNNWVSSLKKDIQANIASLM